jgi:import inner membrane translocase subunit TIM23
MGSEGARRGGGGGGIGEEGSADATSRIYKPFAQYRGSGFDPKSAELLYRLTSSPEFLFPEEEAVQRRNWSENLTYYTGCGYLSGAVAGGAMGLVEGYRAAEPGDTAKLRVNRLLNASGHRGRSYGNKMGVVGLLYAGMESGIVHYRDKDDVLNSVMAGLGTGALFKIASGPRAAALAGAVGGLAAGLAVSGKHLLKRYSPI